MITHLLTNPQLELSSAEDWSLHSPQRADSIVFSVSVCSNRRFGPSFQKCELLFSMGLSPRAGVKGVVFSSLIKELESLTNDR